MLTGVSCRSWKFCIATGPSSSTVTNPPNQVIVDTWNGSRWSLAKAPAVAATPYIEPSAVSCASTSDCWVVGTQVVGSTVRVVTESWNGKKWSLGHSANVGANDGLRAITCPSTKSCWAGGTTADKSGDDSHTLAERYSG
jgi:hypothetical protein